MTDIDFDEIDRAVNSVSNPDAGTSTAVPVNVKVTTPTDTPSTPSSLAERRSSGRFMDVVHPSSDMRTAASPASDDIASTNLSSDTTDIDQATDITAPSDDQAAAPLDSPFLANTKVEKRPLGAFSHEVHESGPASSLTQARVSFNNSGSADSSLQQNEERPIERDTPLPEELNTDLLSIESNEGTVAATDNSVVESATPAVGSTSIPQQYAEQPSTGDKPAATVFNTEAYKQPQPKNKKNKKVLFTILWIFLLVVVGAGIGAALYFFVLQRG